MAVALPLPKLSPHLGFLAHSTLPVNLRLKLPISLAVDGMTDVPHSRWRKPAAPQDTLVGPCSSPPVIRRRFSIAVGSTSYLPHKLVERNLVLIALEFPIVTLSDARPVLVGFARCEVVAQLFASPLKRLVDNITCFLGLWSGFLLGLRKVVQTLRECLGHNTDHQVGTRRRVRYSTRRRVHDYFACVESARFSVRFDLS
jgi:hypothetical protein